MLKEKKEEASTSNIFGFFYYYYLIFQNVSWFLYSNPAKPRPPFISLIENKQQKGEEELTQTEEEWHANSIKSFKAFCFFFLILGKMFVLCGSVWKHGRSSCPSLMTGDLMHLKKFYFSCTNGNGRGGLTLSVGSPFLFGLSSAIFQKGKWQIMHVFRVTRGILLL